MNIKAAIFDMDGTLIDSLRLWDMLWAALGEKYRQEKSFAPSPADDKKVRTLTLRDAMELIHQNYGFGESGGELLSLANGMTKDFYANRVVLKSGALDFLKFCRANGVKTCIATATAPDLVKVALSHLDIGGYFDAVFSCATFGKGKESPDIFLYAAAFFGEQPSDIWVFEDSLTAIETAAGIGMHTVGVYDRYNFGQEKIRSIADAYIAEGETLMKLAH